MIPYSVNAPNTIIIQAIIHTPIALTPLVLGIDGLRFTLCKLYKIVNFLRWHIEMFLYNNDSFPNLNSSPYLILIKTSNRTTVTVKRPGIDAVPIKNPSQLLKTIKNDGRKIEKA